MKRRQLLLPGSAMGAVAVSYRFISHVLANSSHWAPGSVTALSGALRDPGILSGNGRTLS